MKIDDLIPLAEYAKMHNKDTSTVRKKIHKGNLEAVKMGRNWMIDRNTPYEDLRYRKDVEK